MLLSIERGGNFQQSRGNKKIRALRQFRFCGTWRWVSGWLGAGVRSKRRDPITHGRNVMYHKNGIHSYTAAKTSQLACHLFQRCWCNSFLLFLNNVYKIWRVFSWTLFAAPFSHITPKRAGNTFHLRLLVARISTTSYYIGSLRRINLTSWFNDQHPWYLSRT